MTEPLEQDGPYPIQITTNNYFGSLIDGTQTNNPTAKPNLYGVTEYNHDPDRIERNRKFMEWANARLANQTISPDNLMAKVGLVIAAIAIVYGATHYGSSGGQDEKIASGNAPAATKKTSPNTTTEQCVFPPDTTRGNRRIVLHEGNPLVQFGGIDASVAVRWIAGTRKAKEECADEALGEVTKRNTHDGLAATFLPQDKPFVVPRYVKVNP